MSCKLILPEENIIRSTDYNSKTLYVITSKGMLRQMPIPLRVRCKVPIENFPVKTGVVIDEVLMTREGSFAYVLNDRPYPFFLFEIILRIE